MPTVFLVPSGTDSADAATAGDYLLRPRGEDQYEAGTIDEHGPGGCTWFGTLATSLLPPLPQVDAAQEAPEQDALLAAVQGLQSAQAHRGG